MLCPNCAHDNPAERDLCEKCATPLGDVPVPPRMRGALLRLQEVARDIALAQITDTQFAAELDRRKAICDAQLRAVQETHVPPEVRQDVEEEVTVGTAGIQAFIMGLETLRSYLTTRDWKTLEMGLEEISQATELLNQALAINFRTHFSFQQSVASHFSSQLRASATDSGFIGPEAPPLSSE